MSFTISATDYNSLRSNCCGMAGVGMLSEFGEQLEADTHRKSTITFNEKTLTVKILASQGISRLKLQAICCRFLNQLWVPVLVDGSENEIKRIRLVCGNSYENSNPLTNDSLKRKFKVTGEDDDIENDEVNEGKHRDKKIRILTHEFEELELQPSLQERLEGVALQATAH